MPADHSPHSGEPSTLDLPRRSAQDAADTLLQAAADLALIVEDLADRDKRIGALEREREAERVLHTRVEELQRELDAARRELRARRAAEERLRRRLEESERELWLARSGARQLEEHVQAMSATVSWRVTRPLRAIRRLRPAQSTQPTDAAVDGGAEPIAAAVSRAAVLFVSGAPEVSRRYRCAHQSEQLELLGATTSVAVHGSVDLLAEVERNAAFVLNRVAWGEDVERFVERARELGKPVLFDTDDLVFDPNVMQHVAALDDLTADEVRLYEEGLHRYRRTLQACDAVLVSTEPLRRLAGQLHEHVVVVPNVASRGMVEAAALATRARDGRDSRDGRVTVGYLSGTNTHNKDLLEATDAIVDVLERFPETRLLAVGPLRLDPRLDRFGARVERLALQAWEDLPQIQAEIDVNLAPLEPDNPFTESKSCIKWIEAGVAGVATVASPRPDFVRVVRHGENGYLAEGTDEWRSALETLVRDAGLRRRIGETARRDVLTGHTTVVQCGELYRSLAAVVPPREPGPLTVNWLMRAPIASNSGGYRNIFRIARILGDLGHTQRLYVEPIAHLQGRSDKQICRFVDDAFGIPTHAEVIVGHADVKPADVSIATHWPTAHVVASHTRSLFKAYFIQDFEPEFYELSDPLYAEAERTYALPLRHICLGTHLAARLHQFTGVPSETVDFALDSHFRLTRPPEARGERIKVLFFARPSLRRRGYDVGVDTLRLLKAERPDVDIVFFGSPTDELGEVPFEFRNLGVIEAAAVAEAMNEAHILLTFSLTNISNVPYEGMACGCAVVDLDLPNVSSMVDPERNCVLAAFEPRALADAIERLIDDPELRLRIARQGAEDAAVRTWERTARMFDQALRNICFVSEPSLAGA
jgi:glycosyltransferase involved in cell wall biosynthesis